MIGSLHNLTAKHVHFIATNIREFLNDDNLEIREKPTLVEVEHIEIEENDGC